MSSEQPMLYDSKILELTHLYSSAAINAGNLTGVSTSVILGAVMEEYNDRYESNLDVLVQGLGDFISFVANTNHDSIRAE